MKISARKIETLLAERGLTKTELAPRCGLCRQAISIIVKRGSCEPRTAYRLAQGLGVELEEILEAE